MSRTILTPRISGASRPTPPSPNSASPAGLKYRGLRVAAPAPIIVWFRRDLRLEDNQTLCAVAETGAPLLPLYTLDDARPLAPGRRLALVASWQPPQGRGARMG